MRKRQEPMPPVFCNQRARLAEHEEFMRVSRHNFSTSLICPDCYLPAAVCIHINIIKRRKT